METRSARRRRLSNSHNQTGVDYISHLPDAVLHHILTLLPIKTVAQSATLSSRWRSLWFTLPDLDFSNSIFNSNSNSNPADIIAGILNARDHKHSNVRLLRFSATLSFSRLNALFRIAVRHKIQHLHIQVSTNDYFNFPRGIIASDSLRVFSLRSIYPGFRLPPSSIMSSGFRLLSSLSLALMILDRPSLVDLFTDSSFPLLKKLNLESCSGLMNLRVQCPVLQDFSLEGCFQLQGLDVLGGKLERVRICSCFDAHGSSWVKIVAPNLKTLVWIYNAVTDEVNLGDLKSLNQASLGLLCQHFSNTKLHSVSALLSAISPAHSLTFEPSFLDILSSNTYFACYLPTFNNVRCLELKTVSRKHNCSVVANIFRSCPILHMLTIKIVDASSNGRKDWRKEKWERIVSEEEHFWETQIEPLESFRLHLKIVRMEGFMECFNEVSLTHFLLKYGTSLQELSIFTNKTNHRDSLKRRAIKSLIMGFSRASPHVKLRYC
ncbi:putative F-box/FBD/LRR-repeat protein At4g03220 [Cucurbita moschata]|uniref:F-box/FBD/LRR-repeat protein At4g03220 n=2 Tax=Cucurbita TaxID=3660 RepID=A0A6J1G8I1_CUCMO